MSGSGSERRDADLWQGDLFSGDPFTAPETIGRLAGGALAPNVALMQLLMQAPSSAAAEAALRAALEGARGEPAERLGQALALLAGHPGAFDLVQGVLGGVDHDLRPESEAEALAGIAAAFDRTAALWPAGASALYALGDPELARRATTEVIDWLTGRALLGPGRRVLEVGCGAGRFLAPLAAACDLALGLEISAVMAAAARRVAGTAGVAQTTGRDLGCIADGSVDLVLFADSFPYLVQAGEPLAARHLAEAARVLRPGGAAAILNASYRGDLERDRRDLASWGAEAGLPRLALETDVFTLWDAPAFLLRR